LNSGLQTITLWDSDKEPDAKQGEIYLWNGYFENGSIHSLLRYVDLHGDRLRNKYLGFIHDLGETRVNGRRVIDHCAFEDGLSYWWMTLLVEKSPWKSPSITDVLRVLAVEEVLVDNKPSQVILTGNNVLLDQVISDLCLSLGIAYKWRRMPRVSLFPFSLRKIYRLLPHVVQAQISLFRYLLDRYPFRRTKNAAWAAENQDLLICSYFFSLNPAFTEKGYFRSNYWESLHDLIKRLGIKCNWLQIYYPHDAVSSPDIAIELNERFNLHDEEDGFHFFVDAYLSWSAVFRVLKQWLGLMLVAWRMRGIVSAFRPADSKLWLWPLMRNDWNASFYGQVAISNLLWIELFDGALRAIPQQKKGLYLCENQAWERAFIHAWRKHGHGELIAVAHATVRYWDLRYFIDARTIQSSAAYPLPQADVTALNGNAAIEAYLHAGYPKNTIVECEALRFGYLLDIPAKATVGKPHEKGVNVLILGEYMSSGTLKLLKMMESAAPHIDIPIRYTFKPHPNFTIDAGDYPSLHFNVVTNPLIEVLQDFDIAFSGNSTSAALVAFLCGKSVMIMLDPTELNFSPLRGQSGVSFVGTPEDLARSLNQVVREIDNNHVHRHQDFFFLDAELPRWKQLLA
jgi:surface carbohydrate biosynthesis protein (TIGR04326 family)